MSPLPLSLDRAGVLGSVKPHRVQNGGLLIALFCALSPLLAGCGNPAIDVITDTLGAEDPAGPSKDHRLGQPCLACHGPYYGASPRLSIGGTVFGNPTADTTKLIPVPNVLVRVFDTGLNAGRIAPISTCSGNFKIDYDDYVPQFPLEVSVECPDADNPEATKDSRPVHLTMQSRVSREGSCNQCHHGNRDQSSPGFVVCDARAFPTYKAQPTNDPKCKGAVRSWWTAASNVGP